MRSLRTVIIALQVSITITLMVVGAMTTEYFKSSNDRPVARYLRVRASLEEYFPSY